MEKKAKITRTTFKNEWAGPNGTVYYHTIELDNGDKGSIGSKEKMPAKLNPGSELTYTIEGDKIKAVNTPQNGGGFGGGKKVVDPRVQLAGFAMSYTKDLAVAKVISLEQMESMFEKMYARMISKLQ